VGSVSRRTRTSGEAKDGRGGNERDERSRVVVAALAAELMVTAFNGEGSNVDAAMRSYGLGGVGDVVA
jgi:hypothetical protein